MSTLQTLSFNYKQCKKEVQQLKTLLSSKTVLKERDHILPFFKKRLHLSAFIASYYPGMYDPR